MTMAPPVNVIVAKPPNWHALNLAFGLEDKGAIIFSYGHAIYNPDNVKIERQIMDHELVHCRRQIDMDGGVEAWWHRYMLDAKFRLDEEIPAHRAEYKSYCNLVASMKDARNRKRIYLHFCAKRLSGPLYGRMIPYDRARGLIRSDA